MKSLCLEMLAPLSLSPSLPLSLSFHLGAMARRCSHCNINGHNLRTCPSRSGACGSGGGGGGVKLFGVRLTEAPLMKKSASMGNLLHYNSSSPNHNSPSPDAFREPINVPDGYLSDDPAHAASSSNHRIDRKKGVPWTEEEHKLFLIGLRKLGKGDWRGIARNFVMSRTPTQVASHAQKYFIRQNNSSRRKRRSSLFDMVPEMVKDGKLLEEEQEQTPITDDAETLLPSLDLTLKRESESEPMDATYQTPDLEVEEQEMVPTLFSAYIPIPLPIWVRNGGIPSAAHEVLKPTPIIRNQPLNIDELVGMSQLSLRDAENERIKPSFTTKSLLGISSRPSAFHVRATSSGSDMNITPEGGGSPIQAV